MPRVSAFYGIVITMYFNEGIDPGRPHFHAQYAGAEASFDIESYELIVGWLPHRANKLVLRWARLHQDELRRNWELLRSSGQVIPIAPLP
jgi:hypothetical protein